MIKQKSNLFSNFLLYFLRLGTFGFGGPVVLVNHMQSALVEELCWVSQEDYQEGLAFAKLSPGPLATQLAMYLGWLRAGKLGATLTGVAFVLPSFLMVVGFAALYLKYGAFQWIQSIFYSIGAAVIGIVAKSAYQLAQKTMGKDLLLWILFVLSAGVTVWTESEFLWIFFGSGLVCVSVKAPFNLFSLVRLFRWRKKSSVPALIPFGLATGMTGEASLCTVLKLVVYFSKMGAVVFGSGLAIVPFLHAGVVRDFHWLSERQFLDAIAIGMITPGPLVITCSFIGYLVAGPIGAVGAALGIFFPAYLFVIILAPYYRRFAKNPQIKAFVGGLTSAAVGGITGAAFILGKKTIIDIPTAIVAGFVFFVLMLTKKIPEPLLILLAGGVGLILRGI